MKEEFNIITLRKKMDRRGVKCQKRRGIRGFISENNFIFWRRATHLDRPRDADDGRPKIGSLFGPYRDFT